jgi:ABC-2 type transport system ATP-binding protein
MADPTSVASCGDRPSISLQGVSKRFGAFEAVSDLWLEVTPGEILGFLGPNGAGKTTTIRLITGFLRPTAGTVRLLGCDMADASSALRARRRLGYIPDVAGLDPGATGLRILDDLAALQGSPPVDREAIARALALDPNDLRRPTGRLSRGTRQKINILQGLQHRPDLLVLDEPTEGLDPLSKHALFTLVREARARGATIFFSSHILSEVEALCDRVALIRAGRLVAVDRIATLRAHLRSANLLQHRATVVFGADAPAETAQRLAALPGVTGFACEESACRFNVTDLNPVLAYLATTPLEDLTIEPPSLEEVFLAYYRAEA